MMRAKPVSTPQRRERHRCLADLLACRIRVGGPISVADYMRDALPSDARLLRDARSLGVGLLHHGPEVSRCSRARRSCLFGCSPARAPEPQPVDSGPGAT
jgi:hypothetical protein